MSVGAPPRTSRGPSALISRSRSIDRLEASSGGGVGRDLEVLEGEARDLLERRRRDGAAPDRARLVDGDEDHEPGVTRRHYADERGHVAGGRVAATGVRLGRGSSLPRHLIALDRRLRAGALENDVA